MKTISTFNALHLGDNLVHLHFLRKLAQAYPEIHFIHGAQDHHLAQLYPVWQDLENLTVKSIGEVGQGAINGWRGAGGHWYAHPQRNDFVAYHLDWFRHLARAMGLESPIHCARDMLFDYPGLRRGANDPEQAQRVEGAPLDFLIVNSPPASGQWQGFDSAGFARLAHQLAEHHSVITTAPVEDISCTQDVGFEITHIGMVAQRARCIIGCVTGPMWPCLNIWNADTVALRVHLLDQERVDYIPERTVHCNSLSLVPEILKDRGLL
jgi:hypothetical protein